MYLTETADHFLSCKRWTGLCVTHISTIKSRTQANTNQTEQNLTKLSVTVLPETKASVRSVKGEAFFPGANLAFRLLKV